MRLTRVNKRFVSSFSRVPVSNHVVTRYGIAAASVAGAAIIRTVLHLSPEYKSRYIVFLLAVLLSAWYGGFGPGAFALVLGALVGIVVFTEPYLSFVGMTWGDVLHLLIYLVVGTAIIYTIDRLKRNERQLQAQLIKQAEVEAALRQSEERFRAVFEQARDAMALSDPEGVVLAANDAYFQLYGYSAAEVIGHSFAIIFPEAARARAVEQYRQVFTGQVEQISYEANVKRQDGAMRIVEARTGFITRNGKRVAMLSVIRDLTERKQAEDALRIRYQLTEALARATKVEEVARIAIQQTTTVLGAVSGSVHIYHPEDNTFEMLDTTSPLPPEQLAAWRRYPADPAFPITDVVLHNKFLWFSSAEEREAAYPAMASFSQTNPGASVLLPLIVGNRAFGGIGLTFAERRTFTESEKQLISSIVFQCASAFERARLAQKAEETAVVQERQRLARELHDAVSQSLFSATVMAESIPRLIEHNPRRALELTEQVMQLNRGAMAEMRTLLLELRPEAVVNAKLSDLFGQLVTAVKSRKAIATEVLLEGEEAQLPDEVHMALYRIAQESITNVVKHSQATRLTVALRWQTQQVQLVISDDGKGFTTEQAAAGLGLKNMQERAAAISASYQIESTPGAGTTVCVTWSKPVRPDARADHAFK